jgi:hypothetical protein
LENIEITTPPEGERITNTDNYQADEIQNYPASSIRPVHIQRELDSMLLVDAIAEIPSEALLRSYNIEWHLVPADVIEQDFIAKYDDSIIEKETIENEEYGTSLTRIKTENGNSLGISTNGWFFYESDRGKSIVEIISFDGRLLDEEYLLASRIFSDVEGAQNHVSAVLNNFFATDNITPCCTIYAFEHIVLQAEQDRLMENDEIYRAYYEFGKIKTISQWSDMDNVYYTRFTFAINGIPLLDKPFSLLDEREIRAFVGESVVSARGLEYLLIEGMLRILAHEEVQAVISVDALLEKVRQKYDDIILTNPVTVTNMRVVYCPIPDISDDTDITLTPMWEVTTSSVTTERGREREYVSRIYFDAYTGEELR